jgi:hypothetical protein
MRTVGVDRHGRVRRQALGAVCYAGLHPAETFWELAWAQFGQRYRLEDLQQVLHGWEGAGWIGGGALDLVGPDQQGVFQLDRFHAARGCGARSDQRAGPALQAVQGDNFASLRGQLNQALAEAPTDDQRRAIQTVPVYLAANADGLVRWTTQLGVPAANGPASAA